MLSYELGSNNFTYNDNFGDMKFKNQQYYLEASSELLDAPEEWFYDMETGTLSLILPEEEATTCPDTDSSAEILRGRTLDNVLEISDSTDVIVADITFWAANIIASGLRMQVATSRVRTGTGTVISGLGVFEKKQVI